ncbi:hypothetical protein TNCV_2590971 [Trichonephila clavipes]|nr:hypothetical protein TNCV_2590971 [Trichonephila clavipes]
MITLVRRILLTYLDDTDTHSPTSELVDKRTNDIVVIASGHMLVLIGRVASDGATTVQKVSLAQPGSRMKRRPYPESRTLELWIRN